MEVSEPLVEVEEPEPIEVFEPEPIVDDEDEPDPVPIEVSDEPEPIAELEPDCAQSGRATNAATVMTNNFFIRPPCFSGIPG